MKGSLTMNFPVGTTAIYEGRPRVRTQRSWVNPDSKFGGLSGPDMDDEAKRIYENIVLPGPSQLSLGSVIRVPDRGEFICVQVTPLLFIRKTGLQSRHEDHESTSTYALAELDSPTLNGVPLAPPALPEPTARGSRVSDRDGDIYVKLSPLLWVQVADDDFPGTHLVTTDWSGITTYSPLTLLSPEGD